MPNVIQIKRSNTTNIPASLAEGELAYSEKSGIKKLYIGTNGGANIETIGGSDYMSKLDGVTAGAQPNSDILKSEIEAVLTGQISSHSHPSASAFLNKTDGTTAPSVTDDTNAGYEPGSFWIDTVGDESYRCIDASSGAAVWVKTTLGTDELANIATTGSADDLSDGTTNKVFLATERTKLTGITAGAQPNNISDPNATALTGGASTDLHSHGNMTVDGGTF